MAQLLIDTHKLRHNIKYVLEIADQAQTELVGVLKGVNSFPTLFELFKENGIRRIGVSRMETARKIKEKTGIKPISIALPQISMADEIVALFSSSLNSEIDTIFALGEAASRQSIVHDIILMVDVGDLREGVLPDDVLKTVGQILDRNHPGLALKGIGANWGCGCGLIPDGKNIQVLAGLANDIENRFGLPAQTVSIGGSLLLDWMENNRLPRRINQIRVGEAILLGNIPTINKPHPGLFQDVFRLRGELLEIKEKPSCPSGRAGFNALGKKTPIKDIGIRQRAIVNIGVTDTDVSEIQPLKRGVQVVCSNSDCAILDVTDEMAGYKPGDVLEFSLNYSSLSLCLMSPFIRIKLTNDHV
ncbi:alanine racemase [Desulfospira joergensenii]|uniref:alanine racemase n=1 Tax=Desulfospira joergensenii TaxID=53329 RepID=UPI0003B3F58F|nr:alanine racemase [Desulfospira joergensenii]